jgi:hypothetical protein
MSDHIPAGNDEGVTDNDGFDPFAAFQARRRIYLTVLAMQRHEHDVMNCIAAHAVRLKKSLLELLSAWLLAQTVRTADTVDAERLSGCTMDEWFALQAEHDTVQPIACQRLEDAVAAEANYQQAAPFGIVTAWFASESERPRLSDLQAAAQAQRLSASTAQAALNANNTKRRLFGRRFLRGCLANVQALAQASFAGDQAQQLVRELSTSIEDEWRRHLAGMQPGMSIIQENTMICYDIYKIDITHE